MADLVDSAQELEHRLRQAALAARRQETGEGRDECADCSDPIPPERRAAAPHAETCIDCQARREKRRR